MKKKTKLTNTAPLKLTKKDKDQLVKWAENEIIFLKRISEIYKRTK